MHESNWYYAYQSERRGPFTWATMNYLVARGGIDRDTLIWTDGYPEWRPACEVPGLLSEPESPQEIGDAPSSVAVDEDADPGLDRKATHIFAGSVCILVALVAALVGVILLAASFTAGPLLALFSLLFFGPSAALAFMARRLFRTKDQRTSQLHPVHRTTFLGGTLTVEIPRWQFKVLATVGIALLSYFLLGAVLHNGFRIDLPGFGAVEKSKRTQP